MSAATLRPTLRQTGFTLIEVVLVLSLLVIIAAVSTPYLGGSFARASLGGASDIVRDALTRGRLTAMQTGKAHVWRFEPKGAKFQLVELAALGLPENNGLPAAPEESQQEEPTEPESEEEFSPSDLLRLKPSRLPEGVIFADAEIAASNQVAALYGAPADEVWSAPILFNPDGTTSDASILLQNDRGQTIRITLRGLTGISTASEVGLEEAP